MSCLDDNDVLALASGGVGLSAQRRGEIEAHLDQCGPCRQLVAFSMQALQSQRSLREKRSSPRPPSGQTAPTAPPPATPAREGDAQLGRYRILKAIGAGSMGVVYLAYDPKLDRNVAIKLLRDGEMNEMRVRLFREAQAMARLSHPNVVAVHDVGESGGQVFVAMEFVEGETLTDWLKKDRTRREVMRVFIQAGRGLAAAHAAGIVHRDFKPDNVLISRDGMVRVTDFGLARNQRRSHSLSESEEISISAPGAIIGSPAYMAPEQLRGEQADARADQFAFCVALYEGLGGVRPFAGKSLAELQLAIESRQLQPTRRRLRAYARRALLRGLSGDKSKRFDSMNAVLAALERDPLRRGLVVGAIGAFLLLIGLTVSTQLRARARLCTGAEAEIATAWNSVERAKIAAAFSAARLTDSGDAEQRVFSLLDNYARAWVAMRREACEATRIRGTQTEELFELRMECLDESKQALAVTASVIASGDTKSLHSATEEAATLPLLSSCADQKALRTRRPEPLAVEQRAGRAEVMRLVAESAALDRAGRYPAALEAAQGAVDLSKTLGDHSLESQSLSEGARALSDLNRDKEREDWVHRAVTAAEESGDPRAAAKAWIESCYLASQDDRRGEARIAATYAAAALARAGGSDELELWRLNCLGWIEIGDNRLDESLAVERRGLAIAERQDDGGLLAAIFHRGIGAALSDRGDYPAAIAEMEIARQTYTRLLGPESKLVVNTVNRLLGRVLVDSGDPGSAIPLLQGTVRFVEATEGPESPGLINPLDSLADALARLGRHPEALVIRRRALQIAVAADDPSLRPQEQCGVGADLLALGRPEVALPELESADQGYSLPAADGVDGAQCRLKLAEALHQLRREPKRVRSLTERARAILLGEDARNENHRYAEDIAEADRLLGDLITPVRRAR